MNRKQIKKHIRHIVFPLLLCLLCYVASSCLLPPLLKRSLSVTAEPPRLAASSERVRLIDGNVEALRWRLEMIREAQEEIILTSFELRDDRSGEAVIAALMEAAGRGVTIRVLLDGANAALRLHGSTSFKAFLCQENIEVKYYNPPRFTALWKLNFRLHDKYLIIDDTAYLLGGRNTHDIYLGNFSEAAQIDRDILVYAADPSDASSLQALRSYFEATWASKDCRSLQGKMSREQQTAVKAAMQEQLESLLDSPEYHMTAIDWEKETIPIDGIALLTGSIDTASKPPLIWQQLCSLMETAQDSVVIESPLLICDGVMLDDLKQLCSSAVSVQLVTNAMENNANLLSATYPQQKKAALDAGLSIIEYNGGRSLHAKTILIDKNISVIGSFNLDVRSACIDTELMLVIDCPELNAGLREQMQQMQTESRQFAPDGSVHNGAALALGEVSCSRKLLNTLLSVLLYPFQYLL